MRNRTFVPLLLFVIAASVLAQPAAASKRCLYVSSYHQGYAWSDGVERGLRNALQGSCELRQFDMDTKRNKSADFITAQVDKVRAIIRDWRPDVVITSDDNAAKYLIKPYFKDAKLPFVFCGVNWTASEYGFPYSNVTGMVEVAPIDSMLEIVHKVLPNARKAYYLGADTLTEKKNRDRFEAAASAHKLSLTTILSSTLDDWIASLREAQAGDVIIMGSKGGIEGWDAQAARDAVLRINRRLSVTNHGWMMPYTVLGMTKVPEEQGEWSAALAKKILAGASPSDFPIIANRKRDTWLNPAVHQASNVVLPDWLLSKAKRMNGKP